MKKFIALLVSLIMLIVLIVLWVHKKDNPINVFFSLICACITIQFVLLLICQFIIFSLNKRIDNLEKSLKKEDK